MRKPVYVVGHKNPDCDSIVSAIAYAELKNKLGLKSQACRLGDCNSETKYLLKKFNFEQPELIYSAKCLLKEIEKDEAVLISVDYTMKQALDEVLKRKNKGVFVVDDNKRLLGIVSISDLTSLWTDKPEDLKKLMKTASLQNIKDTLKGDIYNKSENFKPSGEVFLLPSLSDNGVIYKDGIVIVGNNPDIQRYLIDSDAALIIICGEAWVDNVTLAKAKDKDVSIIHTSLTALECSQIIFQSPSVKEVMTKDVIVFKSTETVEEASNRMAKTRFRTYPVLNEKDQVINAISRFHLFNYEKKRFILVDHNEVTHSVNDLEFGEIIEIIDHHRFGGIETTRPINIIAKTVGATSTIIAQQYILNKVDLSKEMAGLLLGAIISDTLSLKSPTTTEDDIEMARRLSAISKISVDQLSKEMVKSSDSILNKTHIELLYDDFKEFRIDDYRVAIGQSQCKDSSEFFKIKDEFLKFLNEVVITQQYDLLLIMFTDPLGTGSHFLYTGKKSWVVYEGFQDVLVDSFATNIISRKKQVLPIIIETITK
ncbi:MAG: putative manganese-dependent inorganic diphosphatase [Erysipelotrichaceae bacterium]